MGKLGIIINSEHLNPLGFVDDSLIFSNIPGVLENILKDLSETRINTRLRINLEKIVVMFNSFTSN